MGYALITGASSGIGCELAKVFAEHRHNVILVARREEKLKDLARELDDTYGVRSHVLIHDLSRAHSVREIDQWVRKNEIRVDFLVNNAGFVVYGSISDTPWDEEKKMMQLHMQAAVHLIKIYLPEMLKNNHGRILNVCSTGSFVPGPYAALYCATKAFLLSLSEAIAEEVRGTNVTVTALCPGGTKTEFAEKALHGKACRTRSSGMDARKIARIAYRSLIRGRHVVIPGMLNQIQVLAIRFLPRLMVARFTGMMLSKQK